MSFANNAARSAARFAASSRMPPSQTTASFRPAGVRMPSSSAWTRPLRSSVWTPRSSFATMPGTSTGSLLVQTSASLRSALAECKRSISELMRQVESLESKLRSNEHSLPSGRSEVQTNAPSPTETSRGLSAAERQTASDWMARNRLNLQQAQALPSNEVTVMRKECSDLEQNRKIYESGQASVVTQMEQIMSRADAETTQEERSELGLLKEKWDELEIQRTSKVDLLRAWDQTEMIKEASERKRRLLKDRVSAYGAARVTEDVKTAVDDLESKMSEADREITKLKATRRKKWQAW